MKKTATKIKDLQDYSGVAALYKLSSPLVGWYDDSWDYVIVSAASVFGEVETYIFPAVDENSLKPVCWGELPGSTKGVLSHRQALENAGYEVEY